MWPTCGLGATSGIDSFCVCGIQQVRKGTGSRLVDRAGNKAKQQIRQGAPERKQKAEQIRQGNGNRVALGEGVGLICGMLARKVGQR